MAKVIGHMIGNVKPNAISFWFGIESSKKLIAASSKKIKIYTKEGTLVDTISMKEGGQYYNKKLNTFYGSWRAITIALTPDTRYKYEILISGGDFTKYQTTGTFISAPPSNVFHPTRILISSCMNRKNEQIAWSEINEKYGNSFNLNLFLGDTHYANNISRGHKWHETKYQLRKKGFQKIIANTPTYAIYDDHDFIDNNSYGASINAIRKTSGGKIYREKASGNFHGLWLVPKPKNRSNKEGIYHKITYGLIDIYMLDTRYFREPLAVSKFVKDQERRSVSLLGSKGSVFVPIPFSNYKKTNRKIGNQQWEWLISNFSKYKNNRQSDKRIKIICTGSTFESNKDKNENIGSYKNEISKLVELTKGLNNVIFLSGDVHKSFWRDRPEFETNPPAKEIVSSGVGIESRNEFVVLDIFSGNENKIKIHFHLRKGYTTREIKLT